MANVYDVKIRFMRRLQIREYEPAESEITISAQLSDDDDYKDVAQGLLLDARELVKSALTGKPVGKTETKVTKTKADKKAAKKAPVDEIPADTNSASEIPGDDETVALSPAEVKKALAAEKRKAAAEKRKLAAAEKKAKAAAAKKAAADEIPSDDGGDEIPGDDGDEDGELSADKLHEFINSMVTSRKVKPKQIKGILAGYDAARISDVPAENRQDVKDAIELLAG